jgi:hypothetical protein
MWATHVHGSAGWPVYQLQVPGYNSAQLAATAAAPATAITAAAVAAAAGADRPAAG